MQPTLCSKCKKNVAVVFISRQNEKGEMVNEGLCLKCAAQLGLPQVEEMMKRMGISPEDLENINNEMMQAFGGAEELSDMPAPQDEDDEDDGESGKTATFPFLNRLFGGSNPPAEKSDAPSGREEAPKGRKADKKHKYLDSYCINLSQRARDGKLDAVIGREEEIQRVVQILNRRQKNNPCLIGEPGVGKTAIAEGLAQRIAAGDVPFKLRDKQVYLLDLTALVAGTQFRGQFEQRMKGLIDEVKNTPLDSTFDHVAALLASMPRLLLKFVVWFLKTLDYFGLLPTFLTDLSPFHGTVIFTSMGSLGIPPIVHHLYNFGNLPVFVAFGRKYRKVELDLQGKPVTRRYVDFVMNMDERIVDGFYYATVMKYFEKLLREPEQLDLSPEEVIRDIP